MGETRKSKIQNLVLNQEKFGTVMRNYSKFLGKNNCFLDEPNITSNVNIRVSNVNIHLVFDIDKQILGEGQFGKVRIARQKSMPSRIFALKTVQKEKTRSFLNCVYREVVLLSQCDHPNIAKFYETFDTSEIVHFQLEYCSGGNLGEFIKNTENVQEKTAKGLIRQVLLAINHMHLRGICHRDIKPENFIFAYKGVEASLKLVDFGFAKRFFGNNGKSRLYNLVGTPAFVAPEILTGDYDEKCDIWSAGILLYQLVSGIIPFSFDGDQKRLFKQIFNSPIDFKTPFKNKFYSPLFFDLLKRMLTRNEKSRISVSQALAHPWFDDKIPLRIHQIEIRKLIENFKEFKVYNSFQKNVFKIYVKGLSEAEIKPYKNLFESIDRDLDGIISFPELKYFLVQKGLFRSNKEILENIEHLHKTDNHHIFYTEFLASTINKESILTNRTLRRLFDYLRVGKNPSMSFTSIENIYIMVGYKFDRSEFEQLIYRCKIKLKYNNCLNFYEFKTLMTNDLEAITSDEEELNSLRQSMISSKNIKKVEDSFAIYNNNIICK